MGYPADICEELNREHANDMREEHEMQEQDRLAKLPRPVQIIDNILTLKCSDSAEAIKYMMQILSDCQSHLDAWVDVLRTGCTVDGVFYDIDARLNCEAMEDLSSRITEIIHRGA